jgi:hypothetical protein
MTTSLELRQEAQLVLSVLFANHPVFKQAGQVDPSYPSSARTSSNNPYIRLWVLVHQPDITAGLAELGTYLSLPTPIGITRTLAQWASECDCSEHDTLIAMLVDGDVPWVVLDGEIWV